MQANASRTCRNSFHLLAAQRRGVMAAGAAMSAALQETRKQLTKGFEQISFVITSGKPVADGGPAFGEFRRGVMQVAKSKEDKRIDLLGDLQPLTAHVVVP